MTAFDIFFLVVLLAFMLGGIMSGFVSKLFGLIGLIVSIWAGLRLGTILEPLLMRVVTESVLRAAVSSTLVSLIVYVVFIFLGATISRIVKGSIIAPVDRMMGLLLGAAQAVVVIGTSVLVGQQFKLDQRDWWRKAVFKHSGDQAALVLDRVVDFRSLVDRLIDADLRRSMETARGESGRLLDDLSRSPRPGTE